jgi:predicted MFS family arabinose efflux permease
VRRSVVTPLVAILAMQSVITMGGYGIPVIAPDAAADLGMTPESVGFLVSTIYLVGMVTGLGTGVLVARMGATRLFQLLLVCVGSGVGLVLAGSPLGAVAGAVLIGCATGPLNPAGSHVLARVAPPHWRALVFSIKQCGTPAGGMLAGAVIPPLVVAYDWRVAFAVVPLAALALLTLAPCGGLGAREGAAQATGNVLRDTLGSLRLVAGDGAIRAVAVTGMCLAACQLALSSYLVLYLRDEVGLSPAHAGATFAVLHVSGIVARVALGAIADRQISAQRLLIVLALVMAASLALIARFSPGWPGALVLGVTVAMGVSGNGWVGLFFLELAKLAPEGRTADVAGGGQFIMYGGIVAGPLLFGAGLALTHSYTACFSALGSAAAGAATILLLRARRRHAPNIES